MAEWPAAGSPSLVVSCPALDNVPDDKVFCRWQIWGSQASWDLVATHPQGRRCLHVFLALGAVSADTSEVEHEGTA